MKICGIYIIQNTINKKLYVGSSVNVNSRLSSHKYQLNKKIHKNQKLQNAVNKYGLNNFNFFIIEKIEEIGLLKDREKFWIDVLNSRDDGYNITVDTYCPARELFKLPKYKEKVSKAHKGKIISQEHRLNAHIKNKTKYSPIKLVNPNGKLIEIHGIRKFCLDNRLSYRSIKSLRSGKIHHHKGWRRPTKENIDVIFDFNHPMSTYQKKLISDRSKNNIGQKNPNYRHGRYVKDILND